jgi:hypothetical protein
LLSIIGFLSNPFRVKEVTLTSPFSSLFASVVRQDLSTFESQVRKSDSVHYGDSLGTRVLGRTEHAGTWKPRPVGKPVSAQKYGQGLEAAGRVAGAMRKTAAQPLRGPPYLLYRGVVAILAGGD